MALRDELRDPWTYLLGCLAGGVAWGAGLPAAGFIVVGMTVAGAKAVSGAVLGVGRAPKVPGPPPPLPTTSDTPEADWLTRAEAAVTSFGRLAHSIPNQILSERSRSMGEQAAQTLDGLRRLAGQASTTRTVAAKLDRAQLAEELGRLTKHRDAEKDPEIRTELTRSIGSVQEQVDIAGRLDHSLAQILARVQSGALGLERLVAQLAEILALSDGGTTDQGAPQLEQLADELEGLRTGLAETEQLSRRALSASGREGTVGETDPASDQKG